MTNFLAAASRSEVPPPMGGSLRLSSDSVCHFGRRAIFPEKNQFHHEVLTTMTSLRHPLLKQLVVLVMIHCLAVTALSAGGQRRKAIRRLPTTITFEPSEAAIEPGKSIRIKAAVKDQQDSAIRNARIHWSVPAESEGLISLSKPLNDSAGNEVLLTGLKAASATGTATDITVHATSGRAASDLVIHYQTAPSEITFTLEGDNSDLLPGARKTITATIKDDLGNELHGGKVAWKFADKKFAEFVFLGPPTNNATKNSIDVVWLSGGGTNKAPSEVPIIATAGAASAVVTVNYKTTAPKGKSTLSFEPNEITVSPGEEQSFVVSVKNAEGVTVSEPKVEFKISDEDKAFVKISGPKDGKYTATGFGGDLETTSRTVRVVASAGGVSELILVRFVASQVETYWDILPPKIVGDNYGRTIKNDYYCIEVTIQNNSGSDLALAGLRFVRNEGQPDELVRPNTSYKTVHGSLQKRKVTHPRAMTLAIVDGLGTLLTGFNPFFHNVNHAKNYSQFIDILSNPLKSGIEKGWKDPYPDELARFEEDVLRDDKIINNNDVFKTKIFVPKRVLFDNSKEKKAEREDLEQVRAALGRLVVLGYKFNRGPVRRVSTTQ